MVCVSLSLIPNSCLSFPFVCVERRILYFATITRTDAYRTIAHPLFSYFLCSSTFFLYLFSEQEITKFSFFIIYTLLEYTHHPWFRTNFIDLSFLLVHSPCVPAVSVFCS